MSNDTYQAFLESEVTRLTSAARKTWIVGLVIAVILGVYFSFILTMVKTFTEPEVAAGMLAKNIKDNYPAFMEVAEESLAQQSEILAEEMSATFQQVVPELREAAEAQLEATYMETIPYMNQEFQKTIASYIRLHRHEILQLAEQGKSIELADTFIQGVMEEFGTLLNERMAENFDGRDLSYVRENTYVVLEAIDNYLALLLETDKKEMTRGQELHVEILSTLSHLVTAD